MGLKPCPFCGVQLLNMRTDEGVLLCVHPFQRGVNEKTMRFRRDLYRRTSDQSMEQEGK